MTTAAVETADPVSEHDPYPRHEPGVYEVRCYHTAQYRSKAFRRWVCRLDCQLIWEPGEVCGFFNLGSGDKPHAGRKSLYWRVWVMASGAQPRKRQVLTRAVFVDKIFRVRIGDVTERYDQTEASEAERYSTIEEFIACIGP